MIDSHCHLDRLKSPLDSTLAQAREAGVQQFLNVCINLENFGIVLQIAKNDDDIFASVGVHPNEMELPEPTVDDLISRADHPKIVAIGETGLDYHYITEPEQIERQQARFRTHIAAAKQCKKPLIIHTREAQADTLQIMREENVQEVGGVMHCFTENWEMAQQALELGFYISFSGIVTFKNAEQIREVVRNVPEDKMLIETDSPYLAPIPYRGKSNQPLFVVEVAKKVAELRGLSLEEIDQITTENFQHLFKI